MGVFSDHNPTASCVNICVNRPQTSATHHLRRHSAPRCTPDDAAHAPKCTFWPVSCLSGRQSSDIVRMCYGLTSPAQHTPRPNPIPFAVPARSNEQNQYLLAQMSASKLRPCHPRAATFRQYKTTTRAPVRPASPRRPGFLSKLPTMASLRALLLLATLVVPTLGATYNLVDTYQGAGFLSGFTHQAIADPTHGRVYVSPLPTISLVPSPHILSFTW